MIDVRKRTCHARTPLAQLMLSTLTLLPLTPTFSYLFKKKKKKKKKKRVLQTVLQRTSKPTATRTKVLPVDLALCGNFNDIAICK